MSHIYEVRPGERISDVAEKMAGLANERGVVVRAVFNDTPIEVSPGSDPDAVVAKWDADRRRQWEEYKASPKYAEDQRKAREAAEQKERERQAAMAQALATLKTGDEQALRALDMPWPHDETELAAIIGVLTGREHDYGTCVYAMSIAAEAAFNYMSHRLGVTGFQASCADLEILRRTRGYKHGFQIINHDNLLYPQYRHHFDKLGFWPLIHENADRLREAANKLLAENDTAHPDVRRHWETLAALPMEDRK